LFLLKEERKENMSWIIFLLIGILIGIFAGYFIGKRQSGENYVNYSERMKSENLGKIRNYLKSADSKISNGDVRKLLHVSDSTACRYLNDLEKEGLIKQVGTDGPKVYYRKN